VKQPKISVFSPPKLNPENKFHFEDFISNWGLFPTRKFEYHIFKGHGSEMGGPQSTHLFSEIQTPSAPSVFEISF
jgi:hypothetical protein